MRRWPILLTLTLVALAQPDADALLKTAEQAMQKGDYAEAASLGAQAATRFEAAGNQARLGSAENLLGAAALNQGAYLQARPHFERAIAIAHALGDTPGEVRRYNNLANVYFYQGQYIQAYETYQTGLKRLNGAEAQSWYPGTRQLSLTNLAVLHQQLGQNRQALEIYREIRALPLQLKPNVEAQMLTNLAIVYRRLGDPQMALDTYRKARQLLAADPNAAASLYTLHNVGVVLALDFQDLPGALGTFQEAAAIAARSGSKRELTLERLFLGETYLRLNRPADARNEFTAALEDARALKLVDELWTALYGLGRSHAAAGQSTQALSSFQQAVDVIESARTNLGNASLKAEFLADKRDVYDALIGQLLDQPVPPLPQILQRMEEGRARNLKELLPAERQAVSLSQIQAALDGQTALLAYWLAGDRIATIWITHDSAGLVQGPFSPQRATLLAAELARRDSATWASLADSLSPLLLPNTLPRGVNKLVIVPDGALHNLPFEVLRTADGQRLVEAYTFSYLPSAHFLLRRPTARPRRWPWQVEVVVFADPIPGPAGGTSPFDATWVRLPYSAAEARSVAAALPGRARLFIGPDNHKQQLTALALPPVLHLATHGAIDTSDSRRSHLVFTPVAGQPESQYLFTPEISKLALSGVELVTLAACESERGRYLRGEGVENFSRAFLGAGAAATVSSLWRVSDQGSAELMGHFYRGLAGGLPKAEALRQSKLALLHGGGPHAHPYYWAPFLLSGDGQNPLSPVVAWWPFAAATAALLALLAAKKFF